MERQPKKFIALSLATLAISALFTFIVSVLVTVDIANYYNYASKINEYNLETFTQDLVDEEQANLNKSLVSILKNSKVRDINIVTMDADKISEDIANTIEQDIKIDINSIEYITQNKSILLDLDYITGAIVYLDITGYDFEGYQGKFYEYLKSDLYEAFKLNIDALYKSEIEVDNYKSYGIWFTAPLRELDNEVIKSQISIELDLTDDGWCIKDQDTFKKELYNALIYNHTKEFEDIYNSTCTMDKLKEHLNPGEYDMILNYSMNIILDTEDEDYTSYISKIRG